MSILKDKTRAVLKHHFSQDTPTIRGTALACGVDDKFVEHVLAENSTPAQYKDGVYKEPSKSEIVVACYHRNPAASIQEIEDETGVPRHQAFKILADKGF